MKIPLCVAVLAVMSSASCMNHDGTTRNRLTEILDREIRWPAELTAIKDSVRYPVAEFPNAVKLILYYGNRRCTLCSIAHLSDYDSLFGISRKSRCRFKIVPLFAPRLCDVDETISLMANCELPDTVYIDEGDRFGILNEPILKNGYTSFLVDRENRIVLVGDPTENDAMRELFRRTLDNMLAHDGVYAEE